MPPRVLRPLDLSQTIDAALNLYTKNAVMLWRLVALVIVPIEVLEVILRRLTLPGDVFLRHGTLYTHGATSTTATNVGLLIVVALGLLGLLLTTGAVFKFELDAYLGRPHTIRDSFAYMLAHHRLLSLLWVAIIAWVMIVVGLILLIVPGIYLSVALPFAIPVLMLEGQRGMAAISRAINLVSGRWWPTFGRLLVAGIISTVAGYFIGGIASAIGHVTTNVTLFEVINGIVGALAWILIAPFTTAIINVVYIDLRVRKERVDAAALLAGGAPAEPPPGVPPLAAEASEG